MAATVAGWGCGLAAEGGAAGRLGTRWRASSARPRCREKATCVHGLGHCQRPADRRGRSSVRGCGASSRGVRGSLAARIREGKKTFCCVTTRRRKFWVLNGLRRGLDSLAARFLGLSVPGFGPDVLATLGLPPRGQPPADLSPAFGILAVALVPAPRLVLAPTPVAEANPRARSAPSGRTALFSRTLTSAHGRCLSQGKSSGRMFDHSPRA